MSRGGVPPSASPTTMTSFVGPVTVLTVQQTADSNERLTKELSDSTTNAGGSATVVTPVNGSAPSDPNPRHHPIMTSSSSQIPRSISLSSLPTPLPKGEREYLGRVERRKLEDGRFEEWNPIKTDSPWETPKEEHMPFELGKVLESERTGRWSKLARPPNVQPDEPPAERRRAHSLPPMPKRQSSKDKEIRTTAPKWGRLRSLLPTAIGQSHSQTSRAGSNPLGPHSVNINDELIAGGLATLMLKLWFERDEKGHRRVPILLHRLRIRISDSLHPFNGNRAVFRIECEYANGTVRWVIYRQLRDFLSLHTHYAFSNAYNRNIDALPDFPKTSLPYLKFLRREAREKGNTIGHAGFTRMQREVLENYLVGLARAVTFHSTVNRLAAFLEISSLSTILAQSGGVQYKAGFLHLEVSKGVGLGSKSTSGKTRRSQKWCAVMDSYLVISEELGEATVFDVLLFDSDFKIEHPMRDYRQELHLLREVDNGKGKQVNRSAPRQQGDDTVYLTPPGDVDRISTLGSIRSKMLKVFKWEKAPGSEVPSRPSGSGSGGSPRNSADETASTTSTTSSHSERRQTPIFDPSTKANLLDLGESRNHPDSSDKNRNDPPKHTFYIENSQMKLMITAKNQIQMLQWTTALEKASTTCRFTRRSRYDSFSPIRSNVAAQWLVDGRDYFWNLSRVILLAKDSIYIHDWWLSPELQLRRPGKEGYRLDRLLQRKAQEGVKICIILYHEVSNRTTPTDSGYTKKRLMDLHENIKVQRSPSQFQTGTFYWAHADKLCVIDQVVAFTGGLDMCFGRWDTPQHVLVDDPDTLDFEVSDQIWPGKDYSNGRVADYRTLKKPGEDMYDRSKAPRMPWHDVGVQIVGQPARDLARHFTERWNYLLRIKNHTRVMPCLLPPPEFKPSELDSLGLSGTCEVQIVRSAGPWSSGTPDRIERSIQNAYLKAIQLSEHFVYIENEFFITSTIVNGVKVENKIGDAIVHRVIRARQEGKPWKCCILIPLLPGYPFPIDHSDAGSLRIIVECQNSTICRGPNSIFGRLRKEGIDPSDYISVFSLRNWAKLRGDVLATGQVYVHSKICIVDDRLAIIGSANINERSQRGDRDSELAVVIRDTDMIDSTMAGKPFKVGRFAHSLRVRLMREHLGVDVDSMYEEDLMDVKLQSPANDQPPWDPDHEAGGKHDVVRSEETKGGLETSRAVGQAVPVPGDVTRTDTINAPRKAVGGSNNQEPLESNDRDESPREERTMEPRDHEKVRGFPSSVAPAMEENVGMEPPDSVPEGSVTSESKCEEGGLDRALKPQGGDNQESQGFRSYTESEIHGIKTNSDMETPKTKRDQGGVKTPQSTKGSFGDLPAAPSIHEARVEEVESYSVPADAPRDSKADGQPPHAVFGEKHATETEKPIHARAEIRRHLSTKSSPNPWTLLTPTPKIDPYGFEDPVSDWFWRKVWMACAVHNTEIYRKVFHAIPDDLITTWKQYKDFTLHHDRLNMPAKDGNGDAVGPAPSEVGDEQAPSPRKSTEPFEVWEREAMEKLLGDLRGNLVIYPTRFLEGEDISNKFLFNADRLLPLQIHI